MWYSCGTHENGLSVGKPLLLPIEACNCKELTSIIKYTYYEYNELKLKHYIGKEKNISKQICLFPNTNNSLTLWELS